MILLPEWRSKSSSAASHCLDATLRLSVKSAPHRWLFLHFKVLLSIFRSLRGFLSWDALSTMVFFCFSSWCLFRGQNENRSMWCWKKRIHNQWTPVPWIYRSCVHASVASLWFLLGITREHRQVRANPSLIAYRMDKTIRKSARLHFFLSTATALHVLLIKQRERFEIFKMNLVFASEHCFVNTTACTLVSTSVVVRQNLEIPPRSSRPVYTFWKAAVW